MADTPRAAVIGAGPAGLAAALTLADSGRAVLLVDADDRLGGTPYELGCKATDRCANCHACLTLQRVRDARAHESIEVITGARVQGLTGPPDAWMLRVGDREEPVCGVIVATGYRLAEVETARPDYGLGAVRGVTTALELERRFRSGALADAPPGTLAFVQCAGSRDSSIGRDYCSRVCCTYALRLARAIHHRLPQIELTLFYQDLTPAGPGFEDLVEECESLMALRRGLPAKIYQEPGGDRPIVCRADTITGELSETPYDEVALSVGLWAREARELEAMLGLIRDEHGFYEGSRHDRVLVAGACRGPMTIGEASEDGRVAAAGLLHRISEGRRGAVALIGEDEQTAELAGREGFEAVRAASVRGVAGALIAETEAGEVPVVGAILTGAQVGVQAGPLPAPVHSLYDASDFEKARSARRVAILLDFWAPYSRIAHERALELAAARSSKKQRTWIVCRHTFTGEPGLEAMMTQVREGGVAVIHSAETPEVAPGLVTYLDPGMGRVQELRVDWIIGAPALSPTAEQLLALGTHHLNGKARQGIVHPPDVPVEAVQPPDNPHLGLSGSPRVGIHVVGWLRDPGASKEAVRRSGAAALAVLATPPQPGQAEVDPDKCAMCLTCVRACPHSAPVALYDEGREKHVSFIQPEACLSCGLCVSLCPADAISHAGQSDDAIAERVRGLDAR